MTAPMPETMSPREKVAEQTIGPVNYDRLRSVIHSATHAALPFAEAPMTIPFSTQERAALQAEIADLIISNLDKATVPITALASSGDHAELARLAEWRDRLRADPGRAAHFGSPYADKPMQNGRTYWNSDLADDITALIAEVAALREQLDWMTRDRNAVIVERDRADTMMQSADDRATEAERKLAEAVGLLRRTTEASTPQA